MAGKVYDRQTLVVDRDPTKQLAVEVGRFEKLDPLAIVKQWEDIVRDFILGALKKLTGIDLARLAEFLGPINFLADDFDPIDAAYTFIEDVLLPLGLLAPAAFVQSAIDFIINALTGSNFAGHPIEALRDVLGGLGRGVSTAIESANQATDVARQLAQLVVQTIQSSPVAVVFGDIAEGINAFAFWFLGMFGITQQSVSDQNPVFGKLEGRVAVLEANTETGTSGWNDHFNRADLGTDWATITPRGALEIQSSKYIKSYAARSGRFDGPIQIQTDTWHVQVALAAMDYGNSRVYVATNGAATDASFTNGLCFDFSHQSFGFRLTMYTMAGGLLAGMTERKARSWDVGVVKNGDVFAVERIGDTFYVFRNNDEVTEMAWQDTGSVVQSGAGHRAVAILTNTANNASFSGPGFDDISAYDIKVD